MNKHESTDTQFPVPHTGSLEVAIPSYKVKSWQTERSTLSLDPYRRGGGHRANCCPQDWRHRQTPGIMSSESRLTQWNPCWSRDSWRRSDEWLGALCGRLWRFKTPRGPRRTGTPTMLRFTSKSSVRFPQWTWEKSPPELPGGWGGGAVLKHSRALCSP